MKYKVGDKIAIKGEIVDVDTIDKFRPYKIDVDQMGVEDFWVDEESLAEEGFAQPKTYEQGLADAWELAKKIQYAFTRAQLEEIFGTDNESRIMDTYTPEEALAKIEEYEEGKSSLKIGDEIITCYGETFVVLSVTDDYAYGYSNDGRYEDFPIQHIEEYIGNGRSEKTGRHFNVEQFFSPEKEEDMERD